MATEAELERLIGKALMHDDLLDRLLKDPESAAAAAKEEGIELRTDQASRISGVDPKVARRLAKQFKRLIGMERPAQGFTLW
jgi:hypothetical protein